MSNILIVTNGSTVTVDDETQTFDYSDLMPRDTISAVTWDSMTGIGKVEETVNSVFTIVALEDFTPYVPILTEFDSNKTTIDTAIQFDLSMVRITYLSGATENQTPEYCATEGISYTAMPLAEAQALKIVELSNTTTELVSAIFNDLNETNQLKTRSMINFKWSSLNTQSSTTTAEDDMLIIFNTVLSYFELLVAETASKTTAINELLTTQSVMDYPIDFSEVPAALLDLSDPAVQYIRNTTI